MSAVSGWVKDNQPLAIALLVQAIIAGAYMVNLESRVSTLEVRGSPHLSLIDNRLTVLESKTTAVEAAMDRVKDKLIPK
jgi:hypothetical protein